MKKVAIFTDCHGLLEPTIAVLDDIKKRGITEIYSLGDNIGVGPNPKEVLDLLDKYNVNCIMGNSEEYIILGTDPFKSYFNYDKQLSRDWTYNQLTSTNINQIKLFKHSIDINIHSKKVALCHFANDVRCDFTQRSAYTYLTNHEKNLGYKQFYYTNSKTQKQEIINNSKYNKGYQSSFEEPLFQGKTINNYDAIIMGHTHFECIEETDKLFYCIRACGIGYNDNKLDEASYIILNDDDIFIEKVKVKYDRNKMINSIESSTIPDNTIKRFTKI